MTTSPFKGFYQLSVDERARRVAEFAGLSAEEQRHLRDPLDLGIADHLIENVIGRYALPVGVAVQRRVSASHEYLFLQNFSKEQQELPLPNAGYFDLLEQREVAGVRQLDPWDSTVLRRRR